MGNTAGNLYNSGLFCEHDGVVYFSNAHDNGKLYSMTPDEQNVKKINDLKIRNLLAGGDFLYFFQMKASGGAGLGNAVSTKAFMRIDLKGKNNASITRDAVIEGQLVGNYLYLLTSVDEGLSFQKISIDRKEKSVIGNYEINPSCASNGKIYYCNTPGDHYLHELNTSNDTSTVYWESNLWNPILDNGYFYYMDLNLDYGISRYNPQSGAVEILTEDRVDFFNVGNGYIYYAKSGDTPQLICMRTDGTDKRVIADGVYRNINMTSQYVYFQEFGDDNTCYHSYIGSGSYSEFEPIAKQ